MIHTRSPFSSLDEQASALGCRTVQVQGQSFLGALPIVNDESGAVDAVVKVASQVFEILEELGYEVYIYMAFILSVSSTT